MGVIVNPRGTRGSGKTELVRRLLARYGWRRGAGIEPCVNGVGGIVPVYRERRRRPFAYRLRHPSGGRPLAVIGHYGPTCGGCDTIPASDGGLQEATRWAADYAAAGYDVLIEGLRLSLEHQHSAALARAHDMHVLRLLTPTEQCARNLAVRRRARRSLWPCFARQVALEQEWLAQACERLQPHAAVQPSGFEGALTRAEELLGLQPSTAAR